MKAENLAILRQFAVSPEGRSLEGGAGWCRTVGDFGHDHFGKGIAHLGAANLEEILFRVFPSEVICNASEARSIVAELRAFFRFLKREHRFKNADACLGALHAGAARVLEARLADPANFGVAKLFFLSARPIQRDSATLSPR